MLSYSKAAVSIILDDFKKWSNALKIGFSVFTLIYFAYVFVMTKGNFYANVILVILYSVYTVFELVTYKKTMKKTKKIVVRSYKWSKLLIKAVTLASTLYGIYIAASNVDGISIILATLMIVVWVLQALFEVVILVMEPKIKLIFAAVVTDAKPLIGIHNFFHKREEDWIVDYKEYEREIDILSEKIEETKKSKRKRIKLKRQKTTGENV